MDQDQDSSSLNRLWKPLIHCLKKNIQFSLRTGQSSQPVQVTYYLYPHKQGFLLHSFQFPPTTGYRGLYICNITHPLYLTQISHRVGPKKAIHHHPHFLSFTILESLLPWTNSDTLYPLDGSDWSNSFNLLLPPYHLACTCTEFCQPWRGQHISTKHQCQLQLLQHVTESRRLPVVPSVPATNTWRLIVLLHMARHYNFTLDI